MAYQPSVIQHSGRTFTSLGHKNGVPIWPIEEYLVRARHKPSVAERIGRLNPDGKPEGEWPRGVYRGPSARQLRRKVR